MDTFIETECVRIRDKIERRAKERVKIMETKDRDYRQRESDIKKEIKRQLRVVAKLERGERERA